MGQHEAVPTLGATSMPVSENLHLEILPCMVALNRFPGGKKWISIGLKESSVIGDQWMDAPSEVF